MTSSTAAEPESTTPAEMAPDRPKKEATRIVRSYLAQRSFDVTDEVFPDGRTEADVVFREQGETVLAVILAGAPKDQTERPVLPLDLGEGGLSELRRLVLMYAAEHDGCHATRADVINLYPGRLAHVRHLVRAYSWEE